MSKNQRVLIIGAGVGGLSTAARLAKAGLDVTVLEAHVYPGGCAGTFLHKGYHFDAGATLAGGFYDGGPMDIVARAVGIERWPAHPSDPAMTVHLADGSQVTRYGDDRRFAEHHSAFGSEGERFFRWQEATADALWDLALRIPPWPPQSLPEASKLVGDGLGWLASHPLRHLSPALLADAFRPVATHLRHASPNLRQFIDAQLLIAAQTTSTHAYALYGASALDLPRRGVVHLEGGIGAIAETLAEAVCRNGGRVLYRQEVRGVKKGQRGEGRSGNFAISGLRSPVSSPHSPVSNYQVTTKRGERFEADSLVMNLPPWNIAKLMADDLPSALHRLPNKPIEGWGAFMVYVGLDGSAIPVDFPLHHQVIDREPLGEGNTIFLSLSPSWDHGRAPLGQRVLTISTHTQLQPWWMLKETDEAGYERRKDGYVRRMLTLAERALPGLRSAAKLIMPGTPVTFQRFTRREWGWVGGFAQTSLFRTWAPRLQPNLWMVGDSIFPGQSTAAVALGGLRVANAVLTQVGKPLRSKEPGMDYSQAIGD